MASEFRHQSFWELFVKTPIYQAFQIGWRYRTSPIPIPIPESTDGIYFTKGTCMNHLHCFNVTRIEQTLLSCEENLSRATMLLIHTVTLFHRETYWLFTEHMLSCVESIQYDLTMRAKRSSYEYSIYRLIFQHFPVVTIHFGIRCKFQCVLNRRFINVAQCYNIDFGVLS